MKKLLLIGVLTLTIVASMVVGTLATYTKTLAPIEDTVTAKIFDISADAKAMEDIDVRIAPSEKADWKFKVRNYEDNSENLPTEVNMNLGVEVFIPKIFIEYGVVPTMTIDGEKVTLNDWGTATVNNVQLQHYIYHGANQFKANVADELDCVLNFDWSNFPQSEKQKVTEAIQGKEQAFSVKITGVQSVK